MAKVFISYRRDDSNKMVGRIRDRLFNAFGQENIFRDLDSIRAGEDFRKKIDDAISQVEIVLVVIGENWLSITGEDERPRLFQEDDFVRYEVECALKSKIVIPILVSETKMPDENEFPKSIRELHFRNYIRIRTDPDFDTDIEKLVTEIIKHIPDLQSGDDDTNNSGCIAFIGKRKISISISIFTFIFIPILFFSYFQYISFDSQAPGEIVEQPSATDSQTPTDQRVTPVTTITRVETTIITHTLSSIPTNTVVTMTPESTSAQTTSSSISGLIEIVDVSVSPIVQGTLPYQPIVNFSLSRPLNDREEAWVIVHAPDDTYWAWGSQGDINNIQVNLGVTPTINCWDQYNLSIVIADVDTIQDVVGYTISPEVITSSNIGTFAKGCF